MHQHKPFSATRVACIALIAYALIGVITFGHAWTRVPETRVITTFAAGDKAIRTDQADRFSAGFFGAAFWPLYLSVQLWEGN